MRRIFCLKRPMRGLRHNSLHTPRPRYWLGLFVIFAGLFPTAGYRAAGAGQTAAAPRGSAGELHPQTVLVFPFENAGHAVKYDWLGEGLSELTAERMQDRGAIVISRADRLATLERIGLPDSARFSHATLVKIAGDADADVVVYGQFVADGNSITLEARVMRLNPPSLSPLLSQKGPAQDLLRANARLTWQIWCVMDHVNCPAPEANQDETSFSDPPPTLRLDGLENFIRGLTASVDEDRLRLLREASRLEPAWDRPPYELGLIYFERHDCELALPWLSRVPPNRPEGPDASFDTGVCHLQRNDNARAEAAFSGLIERSRSAETKQRLPEFPEAQNNLGVSRLRQGKWSEAGNEFERASDLDPAEPDYWVNSGIAKLAAKQPAAAVASLATALKLSPDDKEARALLAAVLSSLGRNSDADAVRSGTAESAGHTALPNLQDAAALARLARISKKIDRALVRPGGDSPAAQSGSGEVSAGKDHQGGAR